ncbi:PAS domain-containing protein [Aliihoeflea sp. PC F10.4]
MKDRENWHLTEDIEYEHGRGDPFAAAVRATRMSMIVTDPAQPDNPIVFANEAFQKLTGYDRDEIIGRNCRFLQGPQTDQQSISNVREAIKAGEDIAIDLLNYRKDGSTFWNALYLSPVRSKEGEIKFFFASQMNVTDRVDAQSRVAEQKQSVERQVKRRTADLEAAIEAQNVLLHEVDHRVKNNLTMIGSILRLQLREIDDERTAGKLRSMMERIDALAVVHRKLYQSNDVTKFDIGAFAATLATDLVHASGRKNIHLRTDIRKAEVPAGYAAALGLVINELLANAIGHGMTGSNGTIDISAATHGEDVIISISDDGPGFNSLDRGIDGLGRRIVERLAKQSSAHVEWENRAPGTKVSLIVSVRS